MLCSNLIQDLLCKTWLLGSILTASSTEVQRLAVYLVYCARTLVSPQLGRCPRHDLSSTSTLICLTSETNMALGIPAIHKSQHTGRAKDMDRLIAAMTCISRSAFNMAAMLLPASLAPMRRSSQACDQEAAGLLTIPLLNPDMLLPKLQIVFQAWLRGVAMSSCQLCHLLCRQTQLCSSLELQAPKLLPNVFTGRVKRALWVFYFKHLDCTQQRFQVPHSFTDCSKGEPSENIPNFLT